MNRIPRLLVVLTAVTALAGCRSAPPFTPPKPDRPEYARVYVYWPGQTWRERSGSALELQVDGVPIGLLRYKHYIPVEIPPGHHEFRLTGDGAGEDWRADWKWPDQVFAKPLKPGEILYARLLIKYDQQKNTWTNPGMSYVVQFLPRAPGEARLEMADLKPSRN